MIICIVTPISYSQRKPHTDAHENSLDKSGAYDEELVMEMLENSADTIHWIADHGFEFSRVGYDMYHSDPAVGPSGYINVMENLCNEAGVEIYKGTAAVSLIEEDGVVVGVVAEKDGQEFKINAEAVVLATGGWARSEELVERFAPESLEFVDFAAASIGHTGDGLLMAEDIGAAVYEHSTILGLGIAPQIQSENRFHYDYVTGNFMMVNQEGNRFTKESHQFTRTIK